jgi:hypothetical protein
MLKKYIKNKTKYNYIIDILINNKIKNDFYLKIKKIKK